MLDDKTIQKIACTGEARDGKPVIGDLSESMRPFELNIPKKPDEVPGPAIDDPKDA